ncbi:hypothetical protein CHH68_10320 [Bacillus velezensis]|nr:hypothetical protein CHH68_10320 [Bacillus velezensis]
MQIFFLVLSASLFDEDLTDSMLQSNLIIVPIACHWRDIVFILRNHKEIGTHPAFQNCLIGYKSKTESLLALRRR